VPSRFSERLGLVEVSFAIQTNGMDDALRNSLWNIFYLYVIEDESYGDIFKVFARALWHEFYKEPVSEIPDYYPLVTDEINKRFFESEWYLVYEFFEYLLSLNIPGRSEIVESLNPVLERERSGYRLVHDTFAPITDANEVRAVEEAAALGPFYGVKSHIKQALQCYANREEPDYRNCVKESISAVEAIARELTGKNDLAPALAVLATQHALPGAMKEGFVKLYSYTNGQNGIRHALLTSGGAVTEADARYMLVTCSAFVNYLISRYAAN
jgi:hypothetical protein